MNSDQQNNDNAKTDFPVIEGYEVLGPVGRGWLSSVWKARQVSSGRQVAIKVLTENFANDPERLQRFRADIQHAAGLKHAGIVQLYDFGQSKTTGLYYLVREYISGYSLADWLRRSGRLAESDALAIAHFTADALRFAWHKARLIHGDIKPDNIMIDNDGATKVAGFGLAQTIGAVAAYPADDSRLADTLHYISPELASGRGAPDCRSDIYSLGATLYHMLTGKIPFGDSSPAEVRYRQAAETFENPQAVNPGMPVGTARLIVKMTAKAPGERHQKWDDVLAELIRLERGDQAPAAAESAARPKESAAAPAAAIPGKGGTDWAFKAPAKTAPPAGKKPDKAGAGKNITKAGIAAAPVKMPNLRRPGTSFFKSARRSFAISVAFHALLLLTAGTIIISRVLYNRETKFVGQPPPMKSFEPRKLEHKVKVQKRQRSSSRPSMAPRLVAMKQSSLALPEIKVDSKSVKTTFAPKFTSVSGVGMGVGLGTGYGLGGFGQGVSAYNFFGIKGRADRVAILVDVSESMIYDIRDGEVGFLRVKSKIGEVIDALAEQALFNVIVFADAASACSTNLMIASMENKQKAKSWLAPFNSKGNYGLTTGNLQPSRLGKRAAGGTTRLDLALTGAFDQNVDTILVISDGIPEVKRELTEDEKKAWDEKIAAWERENAVALRARRDLEMHGHYSEKKVWVPGTKRREGQPATEGHWETRKYWGHGLPELTPRPVPPDNLLWWTLDDSIEHFSLLSRELYEKKGGKKAPTIHCIGYCIDEPGENFLKGLAKYFKGYYRRVGGRAKTEEEAAKSVKITTKYPGGSKNKKTAGKKDNPNEPPPD